MFLTEITVLVLCTGFFAAMVILVGNFLALFLVRIPSFSGFTGRFPGNLLRKFFLRILDNFINYAKAPQILWDVPLGQCILILPLARTHL